MFPWQERIIGLRKCHFHPKGLHLYFLHHQISVEHIWTNYIIIREGSQLAWENVIFLNFKFYPEACTYDVILCIVKSQPGTWIVSNKQCHEWIILSRFWSWILMLLKISGSVLDIPAICILNQETCFLWACFM